jgi:hypothetical protein
VGQARVERDACHKGSRTGSRRRGTRSAHTERNNSRNSATKRHREKRRDETTRTRDTGTLSVSTTHIRLLDIKTGGRRDTQRDAERTPRSVVGPYHDIPRLRRGLRTSDQVVADGGSDWDCGGGWLLDAQQQCRAAGETADRCMWRQRQDCNDGSMLIRRDERPQGTC